MVEYMARWACRRVANRFNSKFPCISTWHGRIGISNLARKSNFDKPSRHFVHFTLYRDGCLYESSLFVCWILVPTSS